MKAKTNASEANSLDDEDFLDDIDRFHEEKSKVLFDSDAENDFSSDQNETYIDVPSESESSTDINDSESEVGEPGEKYWGAKTSAYYGSDYSRHKLKSQREADDVEDQEEIEALRLQNNYFKEFSNNDFTYFENTLSLSNSSITASQPIVESKQEQDSLLNKQEFSYILKDLNHINTVLPKLKDVYTILISNKHFNQDGVNFVSYKYHLFQTYLLNIRTFQYLNVNDNFLNGHPIIKRLKVCKAKFDEIVNEKFSAVNSEICNFDFSHNVSDEIHQSDSDDPMSEIGLEEHSAVDEFENANKLYSYFENRKKVRRSDNGIVIDDGGSESGELINDDGKRKITPAIAKSQIVGRRKSDLKNPRTKHRAKYKSAVKRRKGQVRAIRKETHLYSGEATGINKWARRSVKLS